MRTLTDHIVEGDSVLTVGICLCGCGAKTSIAKHSDKRKGSVAGQPVRFLRGHNARGAGHYGWNGGVRLAQGYRFLRTESGEYVQEHIIVASRALGGPLPDGAVVHHVDENRSSNEPSNLVICQDEAYHQQLHRRLRALRSCGNANWMLCPYCKQYDDPKRMKLVIRKQGKHQRAWHEECRSIYRRGLYASRRNA